MDDFLEEMATGPHSSTSDLCSDTDNMEADDAAFPYLSRSASASPFSQLYAPPCGHAGVTPPTTDRARSQRAGGDFSATPRSPTTSANTLQGPDEPWRPSTSGPSDALAADDDDAEELAAQAGASAARGPSHPKDSEKETKSRFQLR